MLTTTKGIVIHSVKYSETSLIVKIFTEYFGLQSYIIKGIRSKKTKMKPALFQPMQMLEITAYNRENKKINHLKEAKIIYPYQSIPYDPIKRSVLIFLTEICYRSLKENIPDKPLSDWLWQAMQWYDLNNEKTTDFHLVFLFQFTKFLGFFPKQPDFKNFSSFDLMEGIFINYEPSHPYYLSKKTAGLFKKVAEYSFNDIADLNLSSKERRNILDALMEYYRLHIENFGEVKSIEILRELFV